MTAPSPYINTPLREGARAKNTHALADRGYVCDGLQLFRFRAYVVGHEATSIRYSRILGNRSQQHG